MHRRRFLQSSAALFAYGLVATNARGAAAASRPSPLQLPRVRVAWDRVSRTTVGLRPRRDSGFLLAAEKFDDKTIIHNYGHGGAGMSLGWGCGVLVAELARHVDRRRAAVIGCGSPGLTAARELQRAGFAVTIYAKAVPPDTTSNMSLASFTPASGLVDPERRTPQWDAQFRRAAALSYSRLRRMIRPGYGVSWVDTYTAVDELAAVPGRTDESLLDASGAEREVFDAGAHPFPTRYAIRSRSLRIEPSTYLEALVRDFRQAGGRIVLQQFDGISELLALEQPVVVNCTGLGARALFGDDELVPIKGQLTLLDAQPEVHFRVAARLPALTPGSGPTVVSMTPRSDGLVIGNMQDRGNWSLEPDEEVRRQTVEHAMQFFSAMR